MTADPLPDPPHPSDWYGAHVEEVSARFEALLPDDVHAWVADLVPEGSTGLAMDLGAGTGRDAAWLARRGFDVVAVEPSPQMLETAKLLHAEPNIRWIGDSLPALAKVRRLGLAFNFILLSGVWMFVPPAERARAFRKLITLLKPGGRIAFTLRMGDLASDRGMHPASLAEIETLARGHGVAVERIVETPDLAGREGIWWANIVVRR
jgi:SAM-dependent methyltransferase